MKTYRGTRGDAVGSCNVTVNGRRLRLRLDVRNHSPTGFEWGYSGSGPAQLALAILCDHLGDDAESQKLYQGFKWLIVTNLDDEWTLTSADIDRAIAELRAEG